MHTSNKSSDFYEEDYKHVFASIILIKRVLMLKPLIADSLFVLIEVVVSVRVGNQQNLVKFNIRNKL